MNDNSVTLHHKYSPIPFILCFSVHAIARSDRMSAQLQTLNFANRPIVSLACLRRITTGIYSDTIPLPTSWGRSDCLKSRPLLSRSLNKTISSPYSNATQLDHKPTLPSLSVLAGYQGHAVFSDIRMLKFVRFLGVLPPHKAIFSHAQSPYTYKPQSNIIVCSIFRTSDNNIRASSHDLACIRTLLPTIITKHCKTQR